MRDTCRKFKLPSSLHLGNAGPSRDLGLQSLVSFLKEKQQMMEKEDLQI